MVSSTVPPNEITLVAVVGACGELGALGHGLWAHAYALKRRLTVNCYVATALVEMYTRCGKMDLAEQVFAGVTDMDTCCYNAMLQGLAFHGHGRVALTLFDRMCAEGFPVDSVTVLAVMCACAHAGLVDEGQWLFDRMEIQFGVTPRIEHYGCMVDILGRAGHLDVAEKLIRGMDITPNAAMYRSLIRACGIHGKLEIGERMIQELMRLEPEHSGNYVLLSNFYARMKLWEDAKKARKEMKAMGIDKSPGSSLLDINGVLHEFLMGDKTHPASREIYAMIQEIQARLKECGHRPSTTAVMFNVEEEDKVGALSYHSERLAIAFALIASSPDWTMDGVVNTKQPEPAVGDGVEVCKEPSRTKTSPGRTSVKDEIQMIICWGLMQYTEFMFYDLVNSQGMLLIDSLGWDTEFDYAIVVTQRSEVLWPIKLYGYAM
uniref:DYW domain-containing protein n=1 Tax=Aegilops tauschii TaxID=37682 RepID=M8BA33_AEGTA